MRYNQTTEQPGAVQLFTNPSFGTIRTAGDADNPLFCLKDVCLAVGINNYRNVRKRLDEDDVHVVDTTDKLGRRKEILFVDESGMYDVILRSDSPNARPFKKWVTKEVLPSIRKNGHYGVAPANPAPVSLEDFRQSLVVSMQELVIKTVAETLKAYMPVVPTTIKPATPAIPKPAPSKTWSLGEMAKELGVDSYYLTCMLRSIKTIKHGPSWRELACANRASEKFFANLPYPIEKYGGTERWDGILVTELGREEILFTIPTYKKQHPYNH